MSHAWKLEKWETPMRTFQENFRIVNRIYSFLIQNKSQIYIYQKKWSGHYRFFYTFDKNCMCNHPAQYSTIGYKHILISCDQPTTKYCFIFSVHESWHKSDIVYILGCHIKLCYNAISLMHQKDYRIYLPLWNWHQHLLSCHIVLIPFIT